MAEAPEEVLIDLEAEDNASPALRSVGRNISVLGATLGIVTRDLGIHNAAVDAVIRGIQTLGGFVRAAAAAKWLLSAATQFLTVSEAQSAAATTGAAAATGAYTGTAAAATAANYGLAASFAAVNAAMGPVGWALLGLGLVGAAVGGYALGGGFGGGPGGGVAAPVGGGPAGPDVQINIGNVSMNTKRDIEETVRDFGTMFYQQTRWYRGR